MNKYYIWVCLVFALGGPYTNNLFAEERVIGEIINVSYQHEIAFSDIGQEGLNVGDVLEVLQSGQRVTYLQVIEVSEALSKLGPVNDGTYSTNFGKVQIGNVVAKAKVANFPRAVVHSESILKNSVQIDDSWAQQGLPSASRNNQGQFQFEEKYLNSAEASDLDKMIAQNKRLLTQMSQLVTENENLALSHEKIRSEKEDMRLEHHVLKARVVKLTEKLNIIINLVEQNLKAYEKR